MVAARRGLWFSLLVCALMLLKAQGFSVPITYVENGVAEGAVCLDGSPPAYHFDKGFGAGINNWLVFVEVTNVLPYLHMFAIAVPTLIMMNEE
ncbi:hypothetical protein WN943_026211 [Citrus x changshan-huyou]